METVTANRVVDYHGFYVSQAFLTDLKNHHPLEAIRTYQDAALIIHAQQDEDVPKEHAARYFASLQKRPTHEKVNTHYIEGADHTFSSYTFENELFMKSAEWLESCYEYLRKVAL